MVYTVIIGQYQMSNAWTVIVSSKLILESMSKLKYSLWEQPGAPGQNIRLDRLSRGWWLALPAD